MSEAPLPTSASCPLSDALHCWRGQGFETIRQLLLQYSAQRPFRFDTALLDTWHSLLTSPLDVPDIVRLFDACCVGASAIAIATLSEALVDIVEVLEQEREDIAAAAKPGVRETRRGNRHAPQPDLERGILSLAGPKGMKVLKSLLVRSDRRSFY